MKKKEKVTSFCRHTAKDSNSSIRDLAAASSSTFSDFICCVMPSPMHLKGDPEPRGLVAFLSALFDEDILLKVDKVPSGFTCSAIASSALNCFKLYSNC